MNSQKKGTTIINVRKFKEWVGKNLSPESALYQVIQKERDELPLDEAVAKTEIICALIDTSVTSATLRKQGAN